MSNPENDTALITRQEIADMLGVSERMVRMNESRWGLRIARVDLNGRVVRYRRKDAVAVLRVFGVDQRVQTCRNLS